LDKLVKSPPFQGGDCEFKSRTEYKVLGVITLRPCRFETVGYDYGVLEHGRTSTSIAVTAQGKGNRVKGRVLFNQQKYVDVDEWFSHQPDKLVNVSSNLTIDTIVVSSISLIGKTLVL